MSIVRYTNKKTGAVAIYESTSYYDPKTKQSRPKRKYLGTEDPETGELIPTSGKRGRKKSDGSAPTSRRTKAEESYKEKYEKLKQECTERDERIKQLEYENKKLKICLNKLAETASEVLSGTRS